MNKLVRVKKDSVIGGVCTGFAQYFDLDVVIFRIIALLLLFSGGGILAYLICWLIMPREDADTV